ncbi:YTX2 protein, partial [Polypterus senegalus]|nr:YTX2 protein [Polypterus senegalus]
MQAFGFGDRFVKYIQLLYSDISGVVKVNGGLCEPFDVRRGVRQGCPLSGMLYVLALEPFLVKLRGVLTGLSIPCCTAEPVKVSAYADVIIIVIKNQEDVDILLQCQRSFEIISSAKINWGKSSAILVGKWTGLKPRQLVGGLQWSSGGLLYLGVFLGDEHFIRKNWDGVLQKVKDRLARWRWILPQLSYRGRMLIINNLIASGLWHKCICLEPPAQLLQNIQEVLINFFWDGLHWLRRSVLFQPLDEGGQCIIDVFGRVAAFRLQTLQELLYPSEHQPWMDFAQHFFDHIENLKFGKTLLLCQVNKFDMSDILDFYKSLCRAWQMVTIKGDEDSLSLFWVLEEPIVNNVKYSSSVGLSQTFINHLKHGVCTKLKHVIDCEKFCWKNAKEIAHQIGVRSVRVEQTFLTQVKASLSAESSALLTDVQ